MCLSIELADRLSFSTFDFLISSALISSKFISLIVQLVFPVPVFANNNIIRWQLVHIQSQPKHTHSNIFAVRSLYFIHDLESTNHKITGVMGLVYFVYSFSPNGAYASEISLYC